MPATVELAGQRFGRLVVIERAKHINGRTAWVCHCDCGNTATVLTQRLSSARDGDPRAVRACEVCRSRSCAACGTLYLTPGGTATCGNTECRLHNRRDVNARSAKRTETESPGAKVSRQRLYRGRLRAEQPEAHAARLAADAARQRRRRRRKDQE